MNKLIVEVTEENLIDLDIKIHNDRVTINEADVTVRMTIEGDSSINYSFNANRNDKGYTISVPRLNGLLPVGERNCLIEVVCFDRYFKAWEGKVELQEQTRVVVTPRNKTSMIESTKVEVTPRARVVKRPVKKAPVVERVVRKRKHVFEIIMDKKMKPKRTVKKKR